MSKHRVKKCESCNEEMRHVTGCMNCEEESIFQAKVKKVMGEFKNDKLHFGHGGNAKRQKQAMTIALNVARKEFEKSEK